jgi:hypothetical protein
MAPKTNQNRIKPNLGLVDDIDEYATKLMGKTAEGTVEEMHIVLGAVTKWIGVRHKLVEMENMDGTGLSAYRSALEGPDPFATHDSRSRTRTTASDILSPELGSELAELAERLPDADPGSARRDSPRPWGKGNPAARSIGGLRAGVSGDGDADQSDNRGRRDL